MNRRSGFVQGSRSAMLQARRWMRRIGGMFFGDLYGVVLFLTALTVYFLLWRVDFFINDNWVIANTLLGVADGHLYIDRIVYGNPSGVQPGMHVIDDRLYGRNYGEVFLALPIFWLLEGLLFLVDFRILLIGMHSAIILALGVYAGRLVGREKQLTVLGAFGSLLWLGLNVSIATDLDPRWTGLVALQLLTMLAAASIGVVLYRMFCYLDQRPTGMLISFIAVLGTPIAFWATIPKRHAFTALAGTVVLYAFLRSRGEEVAHGRARRYRMLAYAAIALTAWINAAEALLFLVVFAPWDALTARIKRRSDLAWIGGAFLLALAPFLLTNLLIVGNPLEPANLWPSYHGNEQIILAESASGSTETEVATPTPTPGEGSTLTPNAGGSGTSPGDSGGIPAIGLSAILAALGSAFDRFIGPTERGLKIALRNPERLSHIFIRRGGIGLQGSATSGVNLTLLESTPVLGALLAAPFILFRRVIDPNRSINFSSSLTEWTPARQVDVLAVAMAVMFSLFYIPRLPLRVQITIRYIIPIIPLLLYSTGRLAPIQRIADCALGRFLWSDACTVFIGGQLGFIWVFVNALTLGEAMQFHALLNLVGAALLIGWIVVGSGGRGNVRGIHVGAVLLGVTVGLTIGFTVLTTWSYLFDSLEFTLPVVEQLTNLVDLATQGGIG